MKIKGKDIVRIEQITCRALLLISVIDFGLCLMMEYFFPLWINEFYCELLHLEFLKNITLGISGSAIISFVCIIFPYLNKRTEFISRMSVPINSIYSTYRSIYGCLNYYYHHAEGHLDTYSIEIDLYKITQEFPKKLKAFIIEYSNSDWTSKRIDKLINMLNLRAITNIHIIQESVLNMVPKEYRNNPLEIPIELKKDIGLKRAEKEIFALLLKKINGILDLKSFEKIIKPFHLYKIKDYNSNLHVNDFDYEINRIDIVIKYGSDIVMTPINVGRLKWKHDDEYFTEREQLSDAFGDILEKVENISDNIIDEFYNALQDDRMADAKKIIDDLKQQSLKT